MPFQAAELPLLLLDMDASPTPTVFRNLAGELTVAGNPTGGTYV